MTQLLKRASLSLSLSVAFLNLFGFYFVKYETLHNNQTISTGIHQKFFRKSKESVNNFNPPTWDFSEITEIEDRERSITLTK